MYRLRYTVGSTMDSSSIETLLHFDSDEFEESEKVEL